MRSSIQILCAKHGVASLDLFGSGATDEWKPGESDLDFIVVFREQQNRIAARYLGLAEGLEALFKRSVDLLTPAAIRNPYCRENVEATRTRIYEE